MDGITTYYYTVVYPLYGDDISKLNLSKYGLKIFGAHEKAFSDIYDDELQKRLDETQLKNILYEDLQDHCYIISTNDNYDNLCKFFHFLTIIKPSSIVQPITEFRINYFDGGGKQVTTVSVPYGTKRIEEALDETLILAGDMNLLYLLFDSYLLKTAEDNFHEDDIHFIRLLNVYRTAIRTRAEFVRFILFMTMADMLVVSNGKDVKNKLRNVTSKLLGSDYVGSNTIHTNMGSLYNIRSGIVHSAKLNGLNNFTLRYMHFVACEILNTFLLGPINLETIFSISERYKLGDRKNILAEYGITDDKRFIDTSSFLIRDV